MTIVHILRTMCGWPRSFARVLAVFLLAGFMASPGHAQVIDRIEINQVGGEAEIQIQFITRIQYLRQASLSNGDVRLYFNLLEIDPLDPRLIKEYKDSPPSNIAPHFTVTYPESDSSLTVSFGKTISYRVRPGKDGRSISIFTPVIKPKSEPQPKAASAVPAVAAAISPAVQDMEREAKQLIDSARAALGSGQAGTAIETLNKLLNLPPNPQSQSAQKMIAEAREKNGEFDKARAEYELYLKLYPDAADGKQVQERLSHLPDTTKQVLAAPAAKKKLAVDDKMTVYGSFSQTYYKGVLDIETTTFSPPTVSSFSDTDQKQLVSQLDLTGRKRTESTDTRIVLRDTHTADFMPKNKDENRLNAAYLEQSARDHRYLYRLGRQMGYSGGVLGRFDGAWLGYALNPVWRVNGVIGTPVDFFGNNLERKKFAGLSVDLTRLPEQWSGSGYFIQQRVGGLVDRQAAGMEARYSDAQRNYTAVLDYDTLFQAVNIAMLQSDWTTESGNNYNMLIDHRRSPSLQITNALPGQPMQSIAALIQSGVSETTLRADAEALSPKSNLFMVGMTHPYSSRLRLGGDFRITNISGTDASGTLPAAAGTGNTYMYSLQAIANSVFLENDFSVVSASFTNAQAYKGRSLAFTQVETFRQNWRVDMTLQYYNQNDNFGIHQTKFTPNIKVSYHLNDSVSFEGEGGIENTRTDSATQSENTRRKYFYVGYRWDFR